MFAIFGGPYLFLARQDDAVESRRPEERRPSLGNARRADRVQDVDCPGQRRVVRHAEHVDVRVADAETLCSHL